MTLCTSDWIEICKVRSCDVMDKVANLTPSLCVFEKQNSCVERIQCEWNPFQKQCWFQGNGNWERNCLLFHCLHLLDCCFIPCPVNSWMLALNLCNWASTIASIGLLKRQVQCPLKDNTIHSRCPSWLLRWFTGNKWKWLTFFTPKILASN